MQNFLMMKSVLDFSSILLVFLFLFPLFSFFHCLIVVVGFSVTIMEKQRVVMLDLDELAVYIF